VFVALGIQYAMRHIAISAPPRSTIFSPHYLTKGTILEKKSLNTKCVFWFSVQLLSETFLILRRNEQDIIYCISTVNRQHFPTLSHKRAGFSKKKNVTEYKMCVLIFCTTFVFYISHSKKKWARYNEKYISVSMYSALRLCTGRMAHTGNRGIALLFLYHSIGREWGVSVTPRLLFTLEKDSVSIVQEAGWAPGPVWTGGIPRPQRDSIPDRPAR